MKSKKTDKKGEPTTRKSEQNKPTLVAFLLDRTGSMASCKEETIKGFNGYLDELQKRSDDMVMTLTQFDSISIDILHNAEPLKKIKKLTDSTYEPRAQTPLYDAMGKTIRATGEAASTKYKVLFVTLTDGHENASSEWTQKTINDLIKEKENNDHWTFAHIGVGEQGWDAARQISAGTISASNVLRTTHADTDKTYRRFAKASASYAASGQNVGSSVANFWAGTEEENKK